MEITGSHTANWTCDWLQRYGWEVLDRPSCSPDFATSDYHLFGLLTKHLIGKQCATDADVKQAVASWLQTLDTDFFLVPRRDQCLNINGNLLLQVWYVPYATSVSCIRRSQNKVLGICAC